MINKVSKSTKRGGIRFSAFSNNLYENQNLMLDALQRKDLNKITQGFIFFKKKKNFFSSSSELLENLFYTLQNGHIILVFETLDMLGDVFLCMGEISNALYSYNHLVYN